MDKPKEDNPWLNEDQYMRMLEGLSPEEFRRLHTNAFYDPECDHMWIDVKTPYLEYQFCRRCNQHRDKPDEFRQIKRQAPAPTHEADADA